VSDTEDGPVTLSARPANIGELFDRLVADGDAREKRQIGRDTLTWQKLNEHSALHRDHETRFSRIERNAFPQLPLWMLVFFAALLIAQREVHRTPVVRKDVTHAPASAPTHDSSQ
jgi:hypothetical protein